MKNIRQKFIPIKLGLRKSLNLMLSKKIIVLAVLFLLMLSISFNIFLYFKFRKEKVLVIKPQSVVQNPALEIPAKLGQLMQLPQDEQPQVFIISGNTPRDQDFIKEAKNGDALLLYLKNQKAILFDPQKNRILKVGPLIFSTVSGQLSERENTRSIKSTNSPLIFSTVSGQLKDNSQ